MDIKGIVNRLCAAYDTRNPFEMAHLMGTSVVVEPLGSIKGYYQYSYRHKTIHINSDLPEPQQRFTCAHELGHIASKNQHAIFEREHIICG